MIDELTDASGEVLDAWVGLQPGWRSDVSGRSRYRKRNKENNKNDK